MSGGGIGRRFETWRDSELLLDLQSAERLGVQGWRHTASGCYLIFCAPLVIVLPLLRAAEVSRAWEVALWFCAAGVGVVAALIYRQGKANSGRAAAVRDELRRRREPNAGIEPSPPIATRVNSGTVQKRYSVFAYDLNEEPAGGPPTQVAGEFDDAAEALNCARWVVERDMSAAGTDGTAVGIYGHWQSFGEGALIDGAPRVEFDCYEHARQHAEGIARQVSATKAQGG